MPHPLEIQYDLTAQELLDAIDRRFRLKVALEGAVAEVHFERKLKVAAREGWLGAYDAHDVDGMHDFTLSTLDRKIIRVEVKTVRKAKGKVGIYDVEIQKTRAAKGDPSSRYYERDHFDVVAVNMGRATGDWAEFRYVLVSELPSHKDYAHKIKVMNRINESSKVVRWFSRLQDLIDAYGL